MNDNELIEKIKNLNKKEKIKADLLNSESFIKKYYKWLRDAYRDSSFFENDWKWHQVVRIALEPIENRKYMYDRLLELLLEHRRSPDDYFTLKTKEEKFRLPNPLADLNKLEILYQKYFEIYQNIKNQIHFDNPKRKHVGTIRGKINWAETIRLSTTEFPMNFVSNISQKQFVTPENILLILCAEWLYRESNRIFQIDFVDPLSDYKKNLLYGIIQNTKVILEKFPFTDVLNHSRKFWKLEFNDSRINDLKLKASNRINQKIIRNQYYSKLLEWMDDFRALNIQLVSTDTSTKHILESTKDIDTIYEAWIFLEFVEYLHKKNILINFQLGENPNCTFEWNGVMITFWYEKWFAVGENKSDGWAVPHNPDFVAMIDDKILAIFDAKNYAKIGSISGPQNKMLAYMNNLNTNYGALIFPYHPSHWDDLNKSGKTRLLTTFLQKIYPNDQPEINKIIYEQTKLSWNDPKFQFREEFPRPAYEIKTHPKSQDDKSYPEKTLALLRMPPHDDRFSREIKSRTLDFIFKFIVERIPIIPKVR